VQGSASQLIYQYQISTDSNFTGAMITTILKGQPSEASVTCAYGTKYFWRGRAYHSKDTSLWSLATDFTTIPAPTVAKIILYSPQNGISNIPLAPLDLIWFKTTNATSFDVQVASDPDFIAVLTSGNVLGNGVSFSGMNAGKTYYWRVRGKIDDISITGPWSDIWKFSTITSSGIHILDQADLFVYPNPASQQVSIEYQGKFGFQLLNSLGQMVMEKNDLTERTIINTEMLAKGYYQVVVKADNGIVHRKLLIE
jgi:hypothetical protein